MLPTSIAGKDSHSGGKVAAEGVEVRQAGRQEPKQVMEAEERRDQVDATNALDAQSEVGGG